MKKYPIKKLYYPDGDLRAYQLGNNFLVKHYYWLNYYEWVISKGSEYVGFSCEVSKKIDSGVLEVGFSYKTGKQRLIELYEEENGINNN